VLGNFIPLFGFLIAVGGMSYLGIFGVKGAHCTTTTRAIISVAVPLVLTFLLLVGGLVAVFAMASQRSL
jgi:heme/copper-type cytochrome/quinol oxidase subunit 3